MEIKKQIKDFLHLYFQQSCQWKYVDWERWNINPITAVELKSSFDASFEIKPILRPLSDMTEEERLYLCQMFPEKTFTMVDYIIKNITTLTLNNSFEITRYLLKQGFDLFGLIESGLAIDKTKMK